jgi:hypothetical protein
MKVGDLVNIDDFGTGIIINIENDIVSTHVEVYTDDGIGWYDLSEVEVVRRENA